MRQELNITKHHLIITGPPAGGKGSLCQDLLKAYPGVVHLSTGDMLRQAVKVSWRGSFLHLIVPMPLGQHRGWEGGWTSDGGGYTRTRRDGDRLCEGISAWVGDFADMCMAECDAEEGCGNPRFPTGWISSLSGAGALKRSHFRTLQIDRIEHELMVGAG